MSIFKKTLSIFTAVVLTLSVFSAQVVLADENNTVTFDVLSINDFHGALIEGSKDLGGAKLVQALKDATKENTIVVSAGDNFNGTATSNLLFGEPVTKMFNEAKVQLSAVGNHEFDWGLDKFDTWSKQLDAEFIAANITDNKTGELVTWAKPYSIIEVEGIKVGFIGITTPETAYKAKPDVVADITFEDPVETANKWIPIVKEAGADVVILLTHIGTMQDADTKVITFEEDATELATTNPDAIITAHSHQPVVGTVDDVPVVQAYYNGRAIAKLTFVVNKETKAIESVTPALDQVYQTKDKITEDAEAKKMIDGYKEQVKPVLDVYLGEAKADMIRDRDNLSTLGEWVADVMIAASGADIAVHNPGGLRTDITAGKITMDTMYGIMPFDNVLDTFKMTGKQIKDLLEFGMNNIELTNGFIQYSGATVEYKKADGAIQITKITLDNGQVVEPNETYSVVTNDFMGMGGDKYSIFLEAKEVSQTVPIRDMLAEAVKANKGIDFKPAGRFVLAEETPVEVITTEETPVDTTATEETTVDVTTTVVTPVKDAYMHYTVVKGDCLSKLAKTYSTTWRELQKLNKIKNANLIYIGQDILVPAQ